MDQNYKFFQNKTCEWFPCHDTGPTNKFTANGEFIRINCLFCFCPLYPYENCGGDFKILENGLKDCSNCLLPHSDGGYDKIIEMIIQINNAKQL